MEPLHQGIFVLKATEFAATSGVATNGELISSPKQNFAKSVFYLDF